MQSHRDVNTCLLSPQVPVVTSWAHHSASLPQSDVPGCSGLLHAEINALLKLDFNNPKDKVMYLTLSPCENCAMAVINSGVKEVVYKEEYRDKTGINLLKGSGIKIRKINI